MLLGDFSFQTFFDHSTRTFKSIHFLPSFYHTSVERRLKKGKKKIHLKNNLKTEKCQCQRTVKLVDRMPKASNTQWSDNRSQPYPLKFILFLKIIGRTILRNCHLLTTIVCPHKLSWAYEGLIIFTGEYISKSSVSKFSCTTITMGCEDKVTLRASELINLRTTIDSEITEFPIWNVL